MTVNNYCISGNPLANALNSRMQGNCNPNFASHYISKPSNASKLQVPVAKPFNPMDMMQQQSALHVPNGEVCPMGMEMNPMFNTGTRGDFFQCPDGTVMHIPSGKIVTRPKKDDGKVRWLERRGVGRDWDDREIMDFDPRNPIDGVGSYVGLSQEDVAYAKMCARESAKLVKNMNPEQKKLLADLENGAIFRKCRLVEE